MMNMIVKMSLISFALFVFGFNTWTLKAQEMHVFYNTGNEDTFTLAQVEKITFDNNNFIVNETSGDDLINISSIRKVYFTNVPVGVDDNISVFNSSKIYAYPNPAMNLINFKNLPEQPTRLTIYNVLGEVVFENEVSSSNNTVDLSKLSTGSYIIRVNGQSINLSKL